MKLNRLVGCVCYAKIRLRSVLLVWLFVMCVFSVLRVRYFGGGESWRGWLFGFCFMSVEV